MPEIVSMQRSSRDDDGFEQVKCRCGTIFNFHAVDEIHSHNNGQRKVPRCPTCYKIDGTPIRPTLTS